MFTQRCIYANTFIKVVCQTSRKYEDDGTVTKTRLYFVYPIEGFTSMKEVLMYKSEAAALAAAESAIFFMTF